MKWRADAYGKGGLIIDGMLRRSDHEPDDLPEDVLMSGLCPAPLRLGVMYAWSMEEDEPAALQPYPGSLLDDSLAASFMGELFISNGIMFLDKGFWTDVLYRDTPVYGDITYILPLIQAHRPQSAIRCCTLTVRLRGIMERRCSAKGEDEKQRLSLLLQYCRYVTS